MGALRKGSSTPLTLALYGAGYSTIRAGHYFNPENRPGTHCARSWTVPRAGLVGGGKSRPIGIRSSDLQPVASRYSDNTISATHNIVHRIILKGYNLKI
jgi:hypothetical protein